jgi:Tol biopolymer transport system component
MNDVKSYRIIAPEVLNSDGHQSFINDYTFITDTYPDRRRMAKLIRSDIAEGTTELLATVYSPKTFQSSPKKGHVACDLHPRASADGRFVAFDSCRTGKRGIYLMKLS